MDDHRKCNSQPPYVLRPLDVVAARKFLDIFAERFDALSLGAMLIAVSAPLALFLRYKAAMKAR